MHPARIVLSRSILLNSSTCIQLTKRLKANTSPFGKVGPACALFTHSESVWTGIVRGVEPALGLLLLRLHVAQYCPNSGVAG